MSKRNGKVGVSGGSPKGKQLGRTPTVKLGDEHVGQTEIATLDDGTSYKPQGVFEELTFSAKQLMDEGRYESAVEKFKQALAIVEANSPQGGSSKNSSSNLQSYTDLDGGMIQYIYCCVAQCHEHLDNYEESIKYHKHHLRVAKARKDLDGQCVALTNLGVALYMLARYSDSLEAHRQSQKIATAMKDSVALMRAYANLGNVYGAMGKYQEARTHHEQQLLLAQQLMDKEAEARAAYNLENDCNSLGQYEVAGNFRERKNNSKVGKIPLNAALGDHKYGVEIRTGWLVKHIGDAGGGKPKKVSNKRLWCVLREGIFAYYSHVQSDLKAHRYIKVGDIASVEECVVSESQALSRSFRVVALSRSYFFTCDNTRDRDNWIQALQGARSEFASFVNSRTTTSYGDNGAVVTNHIKVSGNPSSAGSKVSLVGSSGYENTDGKTIKNPVFGGMSINMGSEDDDDDFDDEEWGADKDEEENGKGSKAKRESTVGVHPVWERMQSDLENTKFYIIYKGNFAFQGLGRPPTGDEVEFAFVQADADKKEKAKLIVEEKLKILTKGSKTHMIRSEPICILDLDHLVAVRKHQYLFLLEPVGDDFKVYVTACRSEAAAGTILSVVHEAQPGGRRHHSNNATRQNTARNSMELEDFRLRNGTGTFSDLRFAVDQMEQQSFATTNLDEAVASRTTQPDTAPPTRWTTPSRDPVPATAPESAQAPAAPPPIDRSQKSSMRRDSTTLAAAQSSAAAAAAAAAAIGEEGEPPKLMARTSMRASKSQMDEEALAAARALADVQAQQDWADMLVREADDKIQTMDRLARETTVL